MRLLKTKSLSYDDVTLIAQRGVVKSRSDVPIEGHRIVISAMTSLIGFDLIKAVSKLPKEYQPTIHLPRDEFKRDNLEYCATRLNNIFIGVGLASDLTYEELAIKYGYKIAFLDIANGYLPQIPERVKQLRKIGFTTIICGSVHTWSGVVYLKNSGVDIVRLGIGTSSQICSTKYVSGFHRGPISELIECVPKADELGVKVLADGGYKYPGDYVKAFLAGADYCMGARLFTTVREARMHIEGNGEHFGMSSNKTGLGQGKEFDESFTMKVKPDTALRNKIYEIWAGICSGISYSGYSTVTRAIGNGTFEVIN